MKLSVALIVCLLFARTPSSADEQPAIKPPLQRRLESLILPEVKFRDADFIGALRYLQKKARQQSNGATQVPFVVDLPEDFKPRYELTLE